jgi:hypothetical protein
MTDRGNTKGGTWMSTVRGSCLCGGVRFEITGPLSNPMNCHCSQCRKQHGAPFRSRVGVQIENFRWLPQYREYAPPGD